MCSRRGGGGAAAGGGLLEEERQRAEEELAEREREHSAQHTEELVRVHEMHKGLFARVGRTDPPFSLLEEPPFSAKVESKAVG